ncbi:MAG: relaxase/mobilization nuclease domain-containing protein [Oscillospiraceae bacterium]|nr:relaxase/mobilization nuclease domain-containing protein [Oscillospiraceae bacterium]
MATTSIWSVKGWLGKVVVYAENPDKTENPAYFEKQGMTAEQTQGLSDVIDYASQTRKTQLTDENAEILRHYVTGINCQPDTARDEMMAAKKKFGKEDGVVAYHGIQSFSPDDLKAGLTPDMAHEIGVKLAKRLWGENYQVLVATHLDKKNHLHSHFIVNTVSWVDGIRYHRTEQDYYNMQIESDKLCREYGLSVIEEPKRGKSKHYGEWEAEKDGKPTYRGMVKAEIDQAIKESMTERQLWDNLYKKGWRIKFGKDITLCPPGKDRGLKLCRNFGEDYSIESIRNRILANTRPDRRIIPAENPPRQVHFTGDLKKARKITGLRALYFYYLYKMGVLPKERKPPPNAVYFLFREDIRFIQNITNETRLLVKHGIDTAEQLTAYKDGLTREIISLAGNRKKLRYQARSIKDEDKLAAVKSDIAVLSENIGKLRQEVRLCEDIEKRSADMKEKIRKAAEDEKSNGKELNKHEPFRRRR